MGTAERDKPILLLWLNVLGWRVELSEDGETLVGDASHCAADGARLRVTARAAGWEELAYQLFEAAMTAMESRGQQLRRPLAA